MQRWCILPEFIDGNFIHSSKIERYYIKKGFNMSGNKFRYNC